MKKILATLAGVTALALGTGACSAVDKEPQSIAPVADTLAAPAFTSERIQREHNPNRSATRPVKPVVKTVSAHENHVNHMRLLAAAKAARIAKAKAERAAKAARAEKLAKLAKAKATKKKVVKKKPVVHKVKKKTQKVSYKSHKAPGGIAACIRKYESGGNYRAQNPSTSASGAYQFVDGTWHAVTGLSGHAKDYPPSVQDRAFYKLWNGGRGAHHWVTAHKCGY